MTRQPYYVAKPGQKPTPLPEPLDLRGKSLQDRIGLVQRRAEWRSRGDSPMGILNTAGCMACHTSMEGISVRTFQHHVEDRYSRRLGYGCESDFGETIGGSPDLASLLAQSGSGEQQLKEAIDASGMSIRPAGNMAAEMARERWEASKKAAETHDAVAARTDYEKALELIAEAKYQQALPLLKAHVASATARLAEQSKQAAANANPTTVPTETHSDAATSPGAQGSTQASEGVAPINPAELEDSRRLLAFVLLGAGQPDAASAVVREMYRQDPQLARRALRFETFGVLERDLRTQFAASVTFANKAKTGSSWLMAALLAQSEDRLPLARSMVEKGVSAGLDRDIADAFVVAIQEAEGVQAGDRQGHKVPVAGEPSHDPKDQTPAGDSTAPSPK